ncbi:MAG: flagellar protein FlaG [Geminicoccaceae bacterium]
MLSLSSAPAPNQESQSAAPRRTETVAPAAPQPPASPAARTSREEAKTLTAAVEKAARALYEGRAVDVESFHDEATGRHVVKVKDQTSGAVIAQSPSDALLRFYASTRDADSLVQVDV